MTDVHLPLFRSLLCALAMLPGLFAEDYGQLPATACNNGGQVVPTCRMTTGDCPSCLPLPPSMLNHLSGLYIHDATLYAVQSLSGLGGCVPCGAVGGDAPANLPSLALKRYYRSRNGGYVGSLGENHFLSTDRQIHLDWGNAAGTDVQVSLFEPEIANYKRHFYQTATSGVLTDVVGVSRDLRLYDVSGALTGFGAQAVLAVITDRDGTQQSFEIFDSNQGATMRPGRLIATTSRTGVVNQVITYQYSVAATVDDPARKWEIATVTAADGTQAVYTYDNSRQRGGRYAVTRIALPNGASTSFAYADQAMTANTLPDGSVATFTASYDTSLQKVRTVIADPSADPGHQFKTVWWTGTSYTKPDGTVIPQPYGQLRRVDNGAGEIVLVSWSDPLVVNYASATSWWGPDSGLVRYEVTDAAILPKVISRAPYFRLGDNPFTATFSERLVFGTDQGHEQLTSMSDELGRILSATYDNSNRRVLTKIDFDGSISSNTWNQFAEPLVETDALGRTTTSTYDAVGNRLTKTYGTNTEQSVWRWEYDARGLMTAAIDANSNRTNYGYDVAGRLTTIVEPADRAGDARATRTFTYDLASRLVTSSDAGSRRLVFSYDARNRVTDRAYADNSHETTVFGTGAQSGLVVATTDRNSNVSTFQFDAAGRQVHSEIAAGTPDVLIEDCTFVPGSMAHKATCTRGGDTTVMLYDAGGRLITTTALPTTTQSLTTTTAYDALRRPWQQQDAYGRSTFNVYDYQDRVVRTVRELVPGAVAATGALSNTLPASFGPALAAATPFVSFDVGSPSLLGGTTVAGDGSITVGGSGYDIWNTSDQFQFYARPVAGDCSLQVRLTSQTQPDIWSKAGIMLRASAAADSAYLYIANTSGGIAIQYRMADGQQAAWNGFTVPGQTAPVLLRVIRIGGVTTLSASTDGASWAGLTFAGFSLTPDSRLGLAVTSHTGDSLSVATFTGLTVSVSGVAETYFLPSTQVGSVTPAYATALSPATPFIGRDIGGPALAGSTTLGAGTISITAGGSDIWNTADQFHFDARPLAGDGSLTVRLDSQTLADAWSKAGIMLRSSDAADASYLYVFRSSGGAGIQYRLNNGQSSGWTWNWLLPNQTAPVWLRISRFSGITTLSVSADGSAWTGTSFQSFALSPRSLIGLAVTSHNVDATSTAVFSGLAFTLDSTPANSHLNPLALLARDQAVNPGYVIDDFVYDAAGQLTAHVDGLGITATTSYDSQGRTASQTNAFGTVDAATSTFSYDAQGNQLTVTDPRGAVTAASFTGRNLMSSVTEANGTPIAATTTYTYSPTRKVVTTTDALNRMTVNAYGVCCDRLVSVTDAVGFVTRFAYDFVGNRTAITDANNLTTATTFDARNRPVSSTNAMGEITRVAYLDHASALPAAAGLGLGVGADGSASITTNPNGEAATEIRDGLGRLARRIDALGHATTMAFDAVVMDGGVGLVRTSSTDAVEATVTSLTDGAGRARVIVDALGKRATAGFDANGNRLTWRDANSIGQDCVFDNRNRDVQCTDTAGAVTKRSYDALNNLAASTDALGKSESSVYDLRNRKTSTTDRVAATTAFAYDGVSNLVSITDAENGVTEYRYEVLNLLDREIFPSGQAGRTARYYNYDAGRRLIARAVIAIPVTGSAPLTAPATSEQTSYAYDNANRLVTRAYPDAKNDTFAYDAASRLTGATSLRYANQVVRRYDAAGRLSKETLSFVAPAEAADLPVAYTYDNANRLTGMTYPDGSQVPRAYTLRGELRQVWDAGTSVAARTYDDGSRLTSTLLGNNLTESRTYIANDNLVASIQIPGVTNFTYQYDANKRKTVEEDQQSTDQSQRFNYDDQNRVKNWKRGTGVAPADPSVEASTWTLSPVGNWNSVATTTPTTSSTDTRTHSKVHELLSINGTVLSYDAKGNLTQDDQGQTFAWDFENRLLSAANLQQGQGNSASYGYDALGRRVKQAITTAAVGTTPTATVPTYFVNAGAQEVVAITGDVTAFNDPAADPEDAGAAPFDPATGTGARGSLLADPTAQRVNFQPTSTDTPDGWRADVGAVQPTASSQGWLAASVGVDRDHLGRPLYDSFIPMGTTTWKIPVANGTHSVVIMCGDADSRAQTNNLLVNGVAVTDPTPYDGNVALGYETGAFDGYALTVNVTAGMLTITSGVDALAAKVNFIEIGAAGTSADAATIARVQAAAVKATHDTAKPRAKTPPMVKRNLWGTYVDELVSYTVAKPRKSPVRYYTHANSLYSIAATTNTAGAVVERYSYNAYGVRTVKNSAGAILAKSAVNQDRGFTSYKLDAETGLYFARTRMYSPKLGQFVSRDRWMRSRGKLLPMAKDGYKDGLNLYSGFFIPNGVDPNGEFICCLETKKLWEILGASSQADCEQAYNDGAINPYVDAGAIGVGGALVGAVATGAAVPTIAVVGAGSAGYSLGRQIGSDSCGLDICTSLGIYGPYLVTGTYCSIKWKCM